MTRFKKILAAFLSLLIAVALQNSCKELFGWSPDFSLAAIIVFALLLDFLEVFFLSASAAFLLNWQPAPSLEITLVILLPLLVNAVKQFLPWRIDRGGGFAVFSLCLLVFYIFADFNSFVADPLLSFEITATTLVLAGLLFHGTTSIWTS